MQRLAVAGRMRQKPLCQCDQRIRHPRRAGNGPRVFRSRFPAHVDRLIAIHPVRRAIERLAHDRALLRRELAMDRPGSRIDRTQLELAMTISVECFKPADA
jgi:hypothetical protein